MKNLTLIYCGEDGDAGKALAETIRNKDTDNKVVLCSCEYFSGPDPDAQKVIIMPDVPEWRVDSIREAYPGRVVAKNPIVMDMSAHVEKLNGPDVHIEADVPNGYLVAVNGDKVAAESPKKRGWPKGKPRKAVA